MQTVKKPKGFEKWRPSVQRMWLRQNENLAKPVVERIQPVRKPIKTTTPAEIATSVRVFNPRPPGAEDTKQGKRVVGIEVCPFCKSKPHCVDNITYPATKLTKSVTRYYVWCTNPFCNARGPLTSDPQEAIARWGNRA